MRRTSNPAVEMQHLRYFLVMDFEATCWESGQQTSAQEIIEFPAVLTDAVTLEPVAEFREFVKPAWNPRISAFCKNLTSIQQEDLDGASPLADVLQRFASWLDGHLQEANPSSILPVTCGDWDLGSMLPIEAKQKGLRYHPTLNWWCNIKIPFAQALCMNRSKGPGMEGMLRMLKIPLVGHHHLGIADSRNIARILQTITSKHNARITATGGQRPEAQLRVLSTGYRDSNAPSSKVSTVVEATTSTLSDQQKHVMKLQKALREIQKLKERKESGAVLQDNQVAKIGKEEMLLAELAALGGAQSQVDSLPLD